MKLKKPISCLIEELKEAKSNNLIKKYFIVHKITSRLESQPYIIITPFLTTSKSTIQKLIHCIVRNYNTTDTYLMYDNFRIRVDYEE